jgi:hypothetical protein
MLQVMLSEKNISYLTNVNALLPKISSKEAQYCICKHCNYVNENEYFFCTNCGYPLKDKMLVSDYHKRIQQRSRVLFRAENAVLVARVILYFMASFLSLGILFIFAQSSRKYVIVIFATVLSGLFFSLALWSRKNPFTALLTAFIVLMVFCMVNIAERFAQSFTTIQGLTGILLCLVLLAIVLKGVQGAYRMNLIKEELQLNV